MKGYPNPGMPERLGLIGTADGGTLFLDEIGSSRRACQANLLRVLDEGGEYHRLGTSAASRARFRLLGATNRDPASLKHDLAARLVLRLSVPGLDDGARTSSSSRATSFCGPPRRAQWPVSRTSADRG